MEQLKNVIFYQIEQAIKTYRMYAQKQIKANGLKITIDQWLVLKSLKENPDFTQAELAEKVFKDSASITRILDLLVQSEYVEREINPNDRRKFNLSVTSKGDSILADTYAVVLQNRKKALEGISENDIQIMSETLKKISKNCK
ncbi:MarR family transcriptional regulator [Flavobacterium sp.]|uniref:MarR family winged helix-turn-helix transcriptional regulator n=1 Tax=Flavobacterium sp. TaxID=239 RepID=UPI002B4B1A9E|nr:MarR family transcriptional regulator [Flavobacterium sp.]HLP63257.1 MarR family transcriptional regulator [Flavobacterium sp.]